MSARDTALAAVASLPAEASWNQILQQISDRASASEASDIVQANGPATADEDAEILAALAKGQADAKAGRVKTPEEVGQLLHQWAKEWSTR